MGVSGRAARQGPSRRGTLPQPLPQAGGEVMGGGLKRPSGTARPVTLRDPPASGRGMVGGLRKRKGDSVAAASIPLLSRLRGRPGGSQRPRGTARPAAPAGPPPAPPASGRGDDGAAASIPLLPRLRGRPGGGQRPSGTARPVTLRDPPASGRGIVGGLCKRQGDGAAAASIPLLPRLRGRPGGGQRPRGTARPVTPRDPPPAPPASGRGGDGRRPQAGDSGAADSISPPPLAGEAGWGSAGGRYGQARRAEGPSPSPSRKREGR